MNIICFGSSLFVGLYQRLGTQKKHRFHYAIKAQRSNQTAHLVLNETFGGVCVRV